VVRRQTVTVEFRPDGKPRQLAERLTEARPAARTSVTAAAQWLDWRHAGYRKGRLCGICG